jgi:hypothetical protein
MRNLAWAYKGITYYLVSVVISEFASYFPIYRERPLRGKERRFFEPGYH